MIKSISALVAGFLLTASASAQTLSPAGGGCPLSGCTYTGPILVPAGSATTPGLGVGIAGTGLYSVSTTGWGLTVNGTDRADYGATTASTWTFSGNINGSGALTLTGNGIFLNNNLAAIGIRTNTTILSSPASAAWQLGAADAAAPVAQSLFVQNVVAGTSNTGGANATIQGSLSTGSGISGDVIFKTGGTGAAATAQNSAVAALTIKGATQHIAYGGSAPVVSACGGTVAGDANATDSSGTVAPGTAASCTITFGKAYTTYNHCRVTSQTTLATFAYSYTLSAITVTATALAGSKLDYQCDGV